MSSTWFATAIRRRGPAWKTGYPGIATRTLDGIEGEVKHSAEGSLAGTLAVLDSGSYSSWTFTIAKDGRTFQHYPLEFISWHAGLPGDRRTDTSLIGNLTLIGIEHEGVAGESLTQEQVAATIALSRWIREMCPHLTSQPPTLRVNLWEHRWLTPTSCPSGRIPWNAIIAALKEEDDMPTLDEIKEALRPVIAEEAEKAVLKHRGWRLLKGSADDVYLVTQGRKRHVFDRNAFMASGYAFSLVDTVSDDELNKIPSA